MIEVHVIYKFASNADRDGFLADIAANDIAAKTHNEAGNVMYDYFIPAFSDNTVFLNEVWQDAEAVSVHATQPHFKMLAGIKEKNHMVEQTIEKYEFNPL